MAAGMETITALLKEIKRWKIAMATDIPEDSVTMSVIFYK